MANPEPGNREWVPYIPLGNIIRTEILLKFHFRENRPPGDGTQGEKFQMVNWLIVLRADEHPQV